MRHTYKALIVAVAIAGATIFSACGKGSGSSGNAQPSQSNTPAVVALLGCYVDDGSRALPNLLMASGATIETCIAAAQTANYAFAGVQDGGQCFAGNTLGFTKATDSDCNMTCTADTTENCGGSWRNSIWSTATGTPAPPPTPGPLPSGSTFVGCYVDDATRALPNVLFASDSTVEGCISAAITANYKYAGLQDGGQCFAGNTLGFASAPATDCNMSCYANISETCGGSWRNSIYSTGK